MAKSTAKRKAGRCSSSRSLAKALNRAREIVCAEFSLCGEFPSLTEGLSCSDMRARWEGMWPKLRSGLPSSRSERTVVRLNGALKSTRRLFDAPCTCDLEMAEEAKNEWLKDMEEDSRVKPARWNPRPLEHLRYHIRELLNGWKGTEGWMETVHAYCPDQQGCFEAKKGKGGTLSVHPDNYVHDYSGLRLGAAKTKGKTRVVTMQPAYCKKVLSKVHNSLYDYLSGFGWLVRGDYTKADAESVIRDRRDGELYTSGDYASATNNIKQEVVKMIVGCIAENALISHEERRVLLESFENLRVYTCHGVKYVRKGSMMGNLVSFPILCLLNKACYDICCDINFGEYSQRVGRFNGDDCLFNADDSFFSLWREVTATFGLIVNEEKTGRSDRFLDLNSKTYDAYRHRFIAKPVLSFLRPSRDSTEDLLPSIDEGLSSFSSSVRLYVINVLMRYEISLRTINLAALRPGLVKVLMRRRWFRMALSRGPAPVKESGTLRSIDMMPIPPVKSRFYPMLDRMANDCRSDYIEKWTGKKVRPYERSFNRVGLRPWIRQERRIDLPFLYCLGTRVWRMIVPKPVGRLLLRYQSCTNLWADERAEWLDDHPCLTTERVIIRGPPRHPIDFSQPAELDWLRQFPLGYR